MGIKPVENRYTSSDGEGLEFTLATRYVVITEEVHRIDGEVVVFHSLDAAKIWQKFEGGVIQEYFEK